MLIEAGVAETIARAPCDALSICLEIESIPVETHTARDREVRLELLKVRLLEAVGNFIDCIIISLCAS